MVIGEMVRPFRNDRHVLTLGTANILVDHDTGTVTGVIDWEYACSASIDWH